MLRCTTLYDVARRCMTSQSSGGQSQDVLAVFGHVQNIFAILVHVGYLKMIVRCRTTSRKTSCDVEAHRTIFVYCSLLLVQQSHIKSVPELANLCFVHNFRCTQCTQSFWQH